VDGGGLDDDVALLYQLLDVGAGVGIPDLRLLGGVEPDFALPDALDGGGEAFLGTKINWIWGVTGVKNEQDNSIPIVRGGSGKGSVREQEKKSADSP
jgi:hypothetical protein